MPYSTITLFALLLVAALTGGAETKQARNVHKMGFLKDLFPLMQDGKELEALLIYRNPLAKA